MLPANGLEETQTDTNKEERKKHRKGEARSKKEPYVTKEEKKEGWPTLATVSSTHPGHRSVSSTVLLLSAVVFIWLASHQG